MAKQDEPVAPAPVEEWVEVELGSVTMGDTVYRLEREKYTGTTRAGKALHKIG